MILLSLWDGLRSKQFCQRGCVLHKKGGAKSRPSTVVPLLSFSFGKQKPDFSGRWLVLKAPSCLWYFQSLKGLAKSLGPSPLAFWPHHSQMLRASHQNKGWDFLRLEKKPPYARRWACGIHRCISTSWSLEAVGRRMLPRSCSYRFRAVKEIHETEQESAPFRGTDTAQTASLTGSGNVWWPTGELSGSFMAWPYIVLRNCWLKTMSWNPGQEDVVGVWVVGPRDAESVHPPSHCPATDICHWSRLWKLWARSVGSVPPWRQLCSDVPGVWTGFHCSWMNWWSGTIYVAVHMYNLFVISCWMMLYISLPSLFIFISKVILFISSVVNFNFIFSFIFFPVQYLQWCCVLDWHNQNIHIHFLSKMIIYPHKMYRGLKSGAMCISWAFNLWSFNLLNFLKAYKLLCHSLIYLNLS